jgi:hypothetical protein
LCEVDADDEEEDPDAEIGDPVDIFGEEVCEYAREQDSEDDVDGLA